MRTWMALLVVVSGLADRAQSAATVAAPNFLWANRAGWTNSEIALAVAVDAAGSCYVTGAFDGRTQIGTAGFTSLGSRDMFLAKYDASGKFLWARSAGGTNYDAGTAVAVDKKNNVFVTGAFTGPARFGGITLTNASGRDIFLAKYDSNGQLLWVRRAGGKGEDSAYGVATDAEGNAFITGYFEGTASFGGLELISKGSDDIFVAKYSASGELKWARRAGGGLTDFGRAIAVDPGGYVYVTGAFYGDADFGVVGLISRGSADVFVARYDNDGAIDWVRQMGGANEDRGYGIAVTPLSQVYVTGSCVGPVKFGVEEILGGNGVRDAFLAKYDAEGKILWVRQAGGKFNDEGYAVAADATGNAYVTGFFKGAAAFGTTQLKSAGAPTFEDKDIFVAKWDTDGRLQWARQAGGRGTDIGYGIAVDAARQIYLIGVFSGDASFSRISLTGQGLGSIFIGKMADR